MHIYDNDNVKYKCDFMYNNHIYKGFSINDREFKLKSRKFFELININHIDILVDVRLYNSTQLAGFSKSNE